MNKKLDEISLKRFEECGFSQTNSCFAYDYDDLMNYIDDAVFSDEVKGQKHMSKVSVSSVKGESSGKEHENNMPEGLTRLEQFRWKKVNELLKATTPSNFPNFTKDKIESYLINSKKDVKATKHMSKVSVSSVKGESSGKRTENNMPEGLTRLEQFRWKKVNENIEGYHTFKFS